MGGVELREVGDTGAVAGDEVKEVGLERDGERDGVSLGSRIMHSWCEVGPPSSNTTSWDSRNLCVGQCMRRKALRCWEKLRNVQGIERADNLSRDCSGIWTWATQPKVRSRETSGLVPV